MALLSAGRRVICARGDSDVWAVRAKGDMASNSVMASMYRLGFFMIGFGFIFVSPPEAFAHSSLMAPLLWLIWNYGVMDVGRLSRNEGVGIRERE